MVNETIKKAGFWPAFCLGFCASIAIMVEG